MLLPIAGGAPAKEAVEKQATKSPVRGKRRDSLAHYQRAAIDRRRVRDIDADVAAVIYALDGRQRIWLAAKLGAGIPMGERWRDWASGAGPFLYRRKWPQQSMVCAAAGPEFEIGEPHVGEDAKDPHAFKRHEEVAVPEHPHVECSVKKRLSGSQKLSG